MTTTLPETTTEIGLEILESLDFDLQTPCESRYHEKGIWGHAGPGALLIRQSAHCKSQQDRDVVICRGAWEFAFVTGLRCDVCNHTGPRDEHWTLLGTL